MARPPAHSDAELRATIRTLMAQTHTVPTYKAVRAAIAGPVSRDRIHAALREARATPPLPYTAAQSHIAQSIACEVAALVTRPLNGTKGYRAPEFAQIKAAVQRTLDAIEQKCHQHDAVIAPYLTRINQLEAEVAARTA